jgi:hypothetical protein
VLEATINGERVQVLAERKARVESRTTPGSWYAVDLEGREGGSCTCKGFQHWKRCRHLEAVWSLVRGVQNTPKVEVEVEGIPNLATSRYQDGHLIAATTLLPVGITMGNPRVRLKGYKIEHRVREAAPRGQQLADAKTDWPLFVSTYVKRLDSFGVAWYKRRFASLLADHPDKTGVVLLCYEDLAAGERCHRRVFAEWWEINTGQQVPELGEGNVQEAIA